MELWMSGEIQGDVGDRYRTARKLVETAINRCTKGNDFGEGLKKWYYIAIILGFDDKDYDEVAKYRRKKKEVEFRLKIDHDAFLKGTLVDQVRLMSDSLLRSINMMPEIGVQDVDFGKLYEDASECLTDLVNKVDAGAVSLPT